MDVYLVIAAYNEGKKIGSVIDELKKAGYRNIIVVDDGSSDNTFDVAYKKGVTVLQHIINRGQGAALKTGIDYSIEKKAEIIVTYDADGQFVVKDIEKCVSMLQEKNCDIALGSRFLGKAVNLPFSKKMVLKLGVFVVFMLYGIKITDSQCGLRAMTQEAAKKISITSDRMEHAADFFSEIMKNKLKYAEVPITVIYSDYSLKKGQDWTKSFGLGIKMLMKKIMR